MDFGLNYTCKNIYSNTKPDNILIIVHDKLDYSTSLFCGLSKFSYKSASTHSFLILIIVLYNFITSKIDSSKKKNYKTNQKKQTNYNNQFME